MTKGKKIGSLCAGLVIICLVCVVVLFLFRPLDSNITIDGLSQAASNNSDYILAKTETGYFELQATSEFAALFDFDAWTQNSENPTGEPALILRFAELWIVEFFADGTAAAYNGYAGVGKRAEAFYVIPTQVADSLITYIELSGEQHEHGDGTIGSGTFNH